MTGNGGGSIRVSEAQYRAAAEKGLTRMQAAERLGTSVNAVDQAERRFGIRFAREFGARAADALRPVPLATPPAPPVPDPPVPVALPEAERARIAAAYGVAPALVPGVVLRVPQGAMETVRSLAPRDLSAMQWRMMVRRNRMRALLAREGRA